MRRCRRRRGERDADARARRRPGTGGSNTRSAQHETCSHGREGAPNSTKTSGPAGRDWPAYGGTADQARYSPLKQISRTNVKRLQVAWTYDSGESGGLQTQPIVVNGVFYAYTPTHKAFALRADTGELLWTFDSGIKGQGPNRGLMYWSEGSRTRVYAAVDQYHVRPERRHRPAHSHVRRPRPHRSAAGPRPRSAAQSVRLTSPGVVYRDLLIVGGRVAEGLPASPGDVRAYDVKPARSLDVSHHPPSRRGWIRHVVEGFMAGKRGGEQLARHGARRTPRHRVCSHRVGSRRLLRSRSPRRQPVRELPAGAQAATGERLWHFQFVHHDLWDRDPPSPPNLITSPATAGGSTRRAGHQAGFVFVFDRDDRQAAVSDRGAEVSGEHRPG